jgi:hypothetical protein
MVFVVLPAEDNVVIAIDAESGVVQQLGRSGLSVVE